MIGIVVDASTQIQAILTDISHTRLDAIIPSLVPETSTLISI